MYFSFLDDYVIFGFLNQNLISLKIISKETENLYYHSFIYDIFKFLGIFIFSFILFKFKGEYIDTSKISLALFHNNNLKKEVNKKKSFLILLLILSSWIIIYMFNIFKIIQN